MGSAAPGPIFRPNSNRAGRAPPEGTDDVAFIVRLIEKFIADGTTDPRHIYITGVSNGGAMTMTMICKRADLFAAAASVIINLTDASANPCHPSRPVPMLMMNGTADPLIPFEGGRGTSRFAAAVSGRPRRHLLSGDAPTAARRRTLL